MMASPFPGMDPYLEEFWRDIHARLVIYAADQLQGQLPADLRARVEEPIVVEPLTGNGQTLHPDLRVVERGRGTSTPPAIKVGIAEPLVLHLESEPVTETFLDIVDLASGRRVLTVIEILSLANKLSGENREKYRQKVRELLAGAVSLVELDLLRAGERGLSVPEAYIPVSHRVAYQACVRRAWRPAHAEVYPLPLRERLPIIGVPLRESDADVGLDLQRLVNDCRQNGGYDADLDYNRPLRVPLGADDERWADQFLKNQGRRV